MRLIIAIPFLSAVSLREEQSGNDGRYWPKNVARNEKALVLCDLQFVLLLGFAIRYFLASISQFL